MASVRLWGYAHSRLENTTALMSARRFSGVSVLGGAVPSGLHTPGTGEPSRALFEACRNGDLERVRKLVNPENVNSRDTAGRKSTPLHFAAGESVQTAALLMFWYCFRTTV